MPLKTFKCPQCGDTLQVNGYSNTAKCESCGSEISIETKTGEDRAKANKYLQLAETAEDAEQYEEAENYYRLAIEHDINNVRAWIGRGFLKYSKDGNCKEADVYLKTALDHSTNKLEISRFIADKFVHEYEDYTMALLYDHHNITAGVCFGMDQIFSSGEGWDALISWIQKEISITEENDEDLKKKIYELVKVRITIKHVNILIKNSDHNSIIFYLLSLNPDDKSLLYKIYELLDKYLIDLLDKDIIKTNVILEYLYEIATISPDEIYFAEKTNILKRIDDISNELILAYKDGQYSYEAKTTLEDFLEFREKVIRALQHIKADITYQVIKTPKRLSPSAFLLYSIIGLASISFIPFIFSDFYHSLKTAQNQVSDKKISQKVGSSFETKTTQMTVKIVDGGCGNKSGELEVMYRGKQMAIAVFPNETESDVEICPTPGKKLSSINKQVDVIGYWDGHVFIANKITLTKKSKSSLDVSPTSASTPKQMSSISPSFDCGKASTESERLICSNNDLAKADIQLAHAYKDAINKATDKSALRSEQNRWLKNERDTCTDVNRMLYVYQVRIVQLSK